MLPVLPHTSLVTSLRSRVCLCAYCRGSVHEGGGGKVSAQGAKGAHAGDNGRAASGRHECAKLLEPQLQYDAQLHVLSSAAGPGLGLHAALHPDPPGAGAVLQGKVAPPRHSWPSAMHQQHCQKCHGTWEG